MSVLPEDSNLPKTEEDESSTEAESQDMAGKKKSKGLSKADFRQLIALYECENTELQETVSQLYRKLRSHRNYCEKYHRSTRSGKTPDKTKSTMSDVAEPGKKYKVIPSSKKDSKDRDHKINPSELPMPRSIKAMLEKQKKNEFKLHNGKNTIAERLGGGAIDELQSGDISELVHTSGLSTVKSEVEAIASKNEINLSSSLQGGQKEMDRDHRQSDTDRDKGVHRVNEKLTQELQREKRHRKETQADLEKTLSSLQRVQKDFSHFKKDASKQKMQLQLLQQKQKDDMSTIADMRQKLSKLQATLSAYKERESTSSKQSSGLQHDIAKLTKALKSKTDQVSKAKSLIKQRDERIRTLKDTMNEKGNDMKSLQIALEEANLTTESLQEQLDATNETRDQEKEAADAKIAGLRKQLRTESAACKLHKARLEELMKERRALHNTIMELKGNIRVFCRVRPILKGEKDAALITYPSLDVDALNLSIPNATLSGSIEAKKYPFRFDRVFKPHETQRDVFSEIEQLVQSVVDGFSVCIFAYGQTGSGKTHTMSGPDRSQDNKGVIPRTVESLFKLCETMKKSGGWSFQIKTQFVEIYNESIIDLLSTSSSQGEHEILHVKRGKRIVTQISNTEEMIVKSLSDVRPLLKRASDNRHVSETEHNISSSRSHSIFRMTITGSSGGLETYGVLNLVDLAGSERLRSTSDQVLLRETKMINRSLSTLGDVIAALASNSKHVPYRNSKLTYLLKDSFGGNCKTLMFVNISPLRKHDTESLNTLRFGQKVNATHIGQAKKSVALKGTNSSAKQSKRRLRSR